jgi:hypothetical protein
MSGERPGPSGPLWPEGISKVRPAENQRRQTPPTGESTGVPKHGEGIHPREHTGGRINTSGSGENPTSRQGDQERAAILPSYYDDDLLRLDAKWLDPKKDKELLKGWDSLAEYALDLSDLIAKPLLPNIPEDDIEALSENEKLSYGMSADV